MLTEGEKTYLYTGFCGKGDKSRTGAMVTVLGTDMLTIEEAPVEIPDGIQSIYLTYRGGGNASLLSFTLFT